MRTIWGGSSWKSFRCCGALVSYMSLVLFEKKTNGWWFNSCLMSLSGKWEWKRILIPADSLKQSDSPEALSSASPDNIRMLQFWGRGLLLQSLLQRELLKTTDEHLFNGRVYESLFGFWLLSTHSLSLWESSYIEDVGTIQKGSVERPKSHVAADDECISLFSDKPFVRCFESFDNFLAYLQVRLGHVNHNQSKAKFAAKHRLTDEVTNSATWGDSLHTPSLRRTKSFAWNAFVAMNSKMAASTFGRSGSIRSKM